ncbi:hypothetical protein [Paludisphaera rhizosphaerae]|uniref:hypothetical protein n=1 Tax=Paludisphaera rhizosphaerae TaxID=2711216 RepID=UPI0013EA20FA|nr:hypothetical protein [Paludisphaera rhizosphaerae]
MSRRPTIRPKSAVEVAAAVKREVAAAGESFADLAEVVEYAVNRAYAEGVLNAYEDLIPELRNYVHHANHGLSCVRAVVGRDRTGALSENPS